MRYLMLVAMIGCTDSADIDSDGDGISDNIEELSGTDPGRPDSDSDGLSDAQEIWYTNTDPVSPDSDSDGVSDGDEIRYGLDPLDARSAGYALGWPLTPTADKDQIEALGRPLKATIGEPLRRVDLLDTAGEWFDLYDFARHGAPVLLYVGPVVDATKAVGKANGRNTAMPTPDDAVFADVQAGEMLFASVAAVGTLTTGSDPTDAESLAEVCVEAGSVGCFADPTWGLWSFIGAAPYGAWLLVDEDMTLLAYVPRVDLSPDFSDLEAVAATLRAQRDP